MWHVWEGGEHTGFWWKHLKDSVNSGDLGVDGRIILNACWINLAQDWNKWRTVVNTVMNRRVP